MFGAFEFGEAEFGQDLLETLIGIAGFTAGVALLAAGAEAASFPGDFAEGYSVPGSIAEGEDSAASGASIQSVPAAAADVVSEPGGLP